MKHKHYDMIVAWASGKDIQFKAFSDSEWEDVDMHGEEWYEHYQYRIKPEQELRKEWVGLTDGEIQDILDCGRGEFIIIQKAQQLLKDKNTT